VTAIVKIHTIKNRLRTNLPLCVAGDFSLHYRQMAHIVTIK